MVSALVLKGLLAGLIVGFVTASIQSWVDRFFLVIILVGLVGLPIQQAVVVNLIVVSLAALMMLLRQGGALQSVREHWPAVVIPAVVGGALGRVAALNVRPPVLLGVLGVYAVLAGLRLVIIKPLAERENKAHPAWIVPIAAGSGLLAGFLSAGGKPFTVPLYNGALGHHPRRAYALATLGVVSGAWAGLLTQGSVGPALTQDTLLLALYLFTVIALTALGVERIWTQRLGRVVTYIIAPILVLIGARFLWVVFR
ncbi:MAG: TSUP family transporter [Anaerolineae bacterium]